MIRKLLILVLLLLGAAQAQDFTPSIKRTRYGSSGNQFAPISIPRDGIAALSDSGYISVLYGGWKGIYTGLGGAIFTFSDGGGTIVDTFHYNGNDNSSSSDHDHLVRYGGDTLMIGHTYDGGNRWGIIQILDASTHDMVRLDSFNFQTWSDAISNRATYRMAPYFIYGTDSLGFFTRGGSTSGTAPWNVMTAWSADFGTTWDVADTVRIIDWTAEAGQARVGSFNWNHAFAEPFIGGYENTGGQSVFLWKWNRATQAFVQYGDTVFGQGYVSERGFDFTYCNGKVFAALVNDDFANPDSIYYAVRDTAADSNWVRGTLALDPAGAASQFGFIALSATENDSIAFLSYMRSTDFSDNFLLCGRYWDFSTSSWSTEIQIGASTTTTNCMTAVGTVPASHGNTIYTAVNYWTGAVNQMEIDEITFTGTGTEPPPATPGDSTVHELAGAELGGVEL